MRPTRKPALGTSRDTTFGPVLGMSRLFGQLRLGQLVRCPPAAWTPAVNLYEDESAYVLCVDLAGIDKDRVEVRLEAGRVRLQGHRAVPTPRPPETLPRTVVHVMEIDHGPFCRDIELPAPVDRERVKATYEDGILRVVLPKGRGAVAP
jgi:HSP20 family protein